MARDLCTELISLYAESRDVLRALVSVAGWYRVRDHADGTWLYAPTATAPGRPLDEAVAAIVERARREREMHDASVVQADGDRKPAEAP